MDLLDLVVRSIFKFRGCPWKLKSVELNTTYAYGSKGDLSVKTFEPKQRKTCFPRMPSTYHAFYRGQNSLQTTLNVV